MDLQKAVVLLKDCEVFRNLDYSSLDTLVFLAYTKHFAEGETIYQKGEKSDNTFGMIVSGLANIIARDGRIIKVVGSKHIIGEIALSDPRQKRTLTVTTAEPTEILEWDIEHIKKKFPEIWKKLVKLAWAHLSEYYED